MTDQEKAAAKAAKDAERQAKLDAKKKEREDAKVAAKATKDAEREKVKTDKAADKEKRKQERLAANQRQNGATRPRAGSTTGRVWEIADALSAEKKQPATRGEVMGQALKVGLNKAMTATQYGRWRKFHAVPKQPRVKKEKPPKVAKAPKVAAAPGEATPPKKKGKKKDAKASGDVTTEAVPATA